MDARKGVLAQSRRHTFIAALLGIPHLVVTVNKMDLVGFREEAFENVRAAFTDFAAGLRIPDLHFIPISALYAHNVVEKSPRMRWFGGDSLLHLLETVHVAGDRNLAEMRFPVQYVIRAGQDFRGFAGQVASGVIKAGDTVLALPSGREFACEVNYDLRRRTTERLCAYVGGRRCAWRTRSMWAAGICWSILPTRLARPRLSIRGSSG